MTPAVVGPPGRRRVEQIMGMPIVLDVREEGIDEGLLDEVFDWFRRVDGVFSTYKEDSEISRLNRGELALGDCQADVREVLARCDELCEQTEGYFDIAAPVPGAVDPSGLVKGWSVDRAAAILEAGGARNFAVNAGGDVRVLGRAIPESCWSVGIQHPERRDRVACVVEAGDLAIATSGAYVRGEHVIDPHTGVPPVGVLSVTIVGPDLATADAYATAAFAMGEAGPIWTSTLRPYEAFTILSDRTTLSTPGFPAAGERAA